MGESVFSTIALILTLPLTYGGTISFEPESSSDSDEPTPLLDTWMESSESETERE